MSEAEPKRLELAGIFQLDLIQSRNGPSAFQLDLAQPCAAGYMVPRVDLNI